MSGKQSRSVRARRAEAQARKKRQRLIAGSILVVVLAALAAIVVLARNANQISPEDVALPDAPTPAASDGMAWGPADAPVLVEEYSDFQ